ncbi:hypothetical protein MRX96_046737 [Rhipicephalus microplus]
MITNVVVRSSDDDSLRGSRASPDGTPAVGRKGTGEPEEVTRKGTCRGETADIPRRARKQKALLSDNVSVGGGYNSKRAPAAAARRTRQPRWCPARTATRPATRLATQRTELRARFAETTTIDSDSPDQLDCMNADDFALMDNAGLATPPLVQAVLPKRPTIHTCGHLYLTLHGFG